MSLWEFSVCVDGWNQANGGDGAEGEAMSIERLRELNPSPTLH